MKPKILILVSLALQLAALYPAQSAETPKFSLPLNCDSQNCFLQNLMDMDPGSKHRDPFCSSATYNGHKGTDIRVRDIPVMLKGVPVLAMADGVVLRARDGVVEKLVASKADRDRVQNIECGNGMVIDHGTFSGKKWTTQTCHMARGSLRVKQGDQIKRGQIIGMMGLSGMTQFPHVHVSLRTNNKLRDWLTATSPTTKQTAACSNNFSDRLLTQKALTSLQQMDSPLLKSGFSNRAVDNKVAMGKVPPPTIKGPLVFYAQFINLQKGDVISLVIKNSKGIYVKQETKPLTKTKAVFTAFAGRKRGLVKGSKFSGQAKLWRDGKIIFTSKPITIEF